MSLKPPKSNNLPKYIQEALDQDIERLSGLKREQCEMPPYNPVSYPTDLSKTSYFDVLITLRHFIQTMSQYHFGIEQSAKQVDLFMMTPTVSSPMGPGSDSEPIEISFGGLKTNLVDSSQFGFEPLLLNGLERVYCYLPSMRGEDPDERHLNQFFHCEAEIVGSLNDVMDVAETYVRRLVEVSAHLAAATNLISDNPKKTNEALKEIMASEKFPRITFDDAVELLLAHPDHGAFVCSTPHGRDITTKGENELLRHLNHGPLPVWITHFDRDRVPFYQKPSKDNPDKVENADLLFPSLDGTGFGGEVLGAGERQSSADEILESLKRQEDISSEPYEWYINLRRHPNYRATSGFGLGIERFIAWALCKPSIRDVSLYPRIKGVQTYP